MGDKIKIKNKGKLEDIGEEIIAAWEYAAANNLPINRADLIGKLNGLIDVADGWDQGKKYRSRRAVEFDLVFDENVDDNTRVVWLAIPTPDVKMKDAGDPTKPDETWQDYIDREFGKKGSRDKKALQDLAQSVLFGCGR